MELSNINTVEFQAFGKQMADARYTASSFEEASQLLVEQFFKLFQSKDGEPEFALLRVFRTMHYDELPSDLQARTDSTSAEFLTLMASMGVEESWCDRRQSQKRRIIEISQNMSPMFKGVFHELGFSWKDSTGQEIVMGEKLDTARMVHYFHVEDVASSSFITDQEIFVRPYGIQSVLAIGMQFVSDAAYVLIGFSKQHISPQQAQTLVNISPQISTVLSYFDVKGRIWAQ